MKSVSSDQARANWRDILDQAATGQQIVIERYGKPIAVIGPYQPESEADQRMGEPRAAYETGEWAAMKAEIVQQLKQELLSSEGDDWFAGWQALQKRLKQAGWQAGASKEEIVAQLRQSREQLFEAEYAHLYR